MTVMAISSENAALFWMLTELLLPAAAWSDVSLTAEPVADDPRRIWMAVCAEPWPTPNPPLEKRNRPKREKSCALRPPGHAENWPFMMLLKPPETVAYCWDAVL